MEGRLNAGQRDHVVKFGDEALQPQPMDYVAGLRVDDIEAAAGLMIPALASPPINR